MPFDWVKASDHSQSRHRGDGFHIKLRESDTLVNGDDFIGRQFQLIETMAEETAGMLLERLVPVRTVRLEIRKPDAVPGAACAFVRLERTRT